MLSWPNPAREQAFASWLAGVDHRLGLQPASLAPASADASFRRYFRIQGATAAYIIMDAPPPQEDVRPFVEVASRIRAAELNAPQVLACDAELGFLLLSDMGSALYLAQLKEASAEQADALMRDAMTALVQFQRRVPHAGLPVYDAALLRRELELFPEWCVQREFGVTWDEAQLKIWNAVSQALIDSALAQPVVAVHRDWMPRNLMVTTPNPGILDFQDAVAGPVTYDMASLLRDAFLSWEEERELDWAVRYWQAARQGGVPLGETMGQDFGEFWRALEWMGLQRHLKVLGIFCRLKHRDGKPAYAQDLPRFFAYAAKVTMRYRELKPLIRLLEPLAGPLTVEAYSLR
jgi:N-acetylmuramate 1-kinase